MKIPSSVANRIARFTQHQIDALDHCTDAAVNWDESVAFVQARNGGWGVRVNGKMVDSIYSPDQSAEKFLMDKPFDHTDLVVLIGCGGGSLPIALARRLTGLPVKIAVIEPNVHLLTGMFLNNTALGELDPGKIQFFCSLQAFKFYLIDISLHGERLRVLSTPAYQRHMPDQLAAVSAALDEAVPIMLSCAKTRTNNTRTWIHHLINNVRHKSRFPSIFTLEGRMQDVPAVLVASGPSLDKNIQHIKRVEDNALICCVNSSLPALLRHGILPHLVFSVETADVTHDLTGNTEALQQLTLVLAETTNPKAFTLPAENTFVMHQNTWNYAAFVAEVTQQRVRGIHGGGCNANAMFAAALMFGCNPVALVGQDLAYTDGRLYAHATDYGSLTANIEGDQAKIIDKEGVLDFLEGASSRFLMEEKMYPIRAWNGESTVYSPSNFNTFRLCFQEVGLRAVHETGVTLVNATEGGAYIEGFDHRPLADYVSELPAGCLNLKARIAASLAEAELASPKTIASGLARIAERLGQTAMQADEAIAAVDDLERLVTAGVTEGPLFASAHERFEKARQSVAVLPLLDSYSSESLTRAKRKHPEDGTPETAFARAKAVMSATRDGAAELREMILKAHADLSTQTP
ncbi:MAG: DUF115 domain-containing protein [Acidobacteriota bacterium]|nr:DUF115 domain-containing protein [Acidobacteriota bacterium]